MNKTLIIDGHPNKESFNDALTKAYIKGAENADAEIKVITIRELLFDSNLAIGYEKNVVRDFDIVEAQEKIKWADHLFWIHPVWWGGLPAITKAFIDRVFLPGFGIKSRDKSVALDNLSTQKTAHIITTLDQPSWYYWLVYGKPSVNQLKESTLEFCGMKPVKVTYVGPIKKAKESCINKWLTQVEQMGMKHA